MKLQQNGDWVGGTTSEVVAVDAKNSTPISAVSYSVDGVDAWHIFCEYYILYRDGIPR